MSRSVSCVANAVSVLLLTSHAAMAAEATSQPNQIPQEQIDAAMRRLEERQRERLQGNTIGSQPAGDSTAEWPLDGPYSRKEVTQAKHEALMRVNSDISVLIQNSKHSPQQEADIAKLRRLADVYRATSIERYRDLLIERDQSQTQITEAALAKWKQNPDVLKKAVERARQVLLQKGIVRNASADYARAEFSNSTRVVQYEAPCQFEFVTESGLVRQYDGSITVGVDVLEGSADLCADIDGRSSRRGNIQPQYLGSFSVGNRVELKQIVEENGILVLR